MNGFSGTSFEREHAPFRLLRLGKLENALWENEKLRARGKTAENPTPRGKGGAPVSFLISRGRREWLIRTINHSACANYETRAELNFKPGTKIVSADNEFCVLIGVIFKILIKLYKNFRVFDLRV